MFKCPNCDEKVHWKHSLTIKPQSEINCVSCGAKLIPVSRTYNMAGFLATLVLFLFLWWVITTNDIIWTLLVIPLAIGIVSLLFYVLIRFGKKEDQQDNF